MSSILRACRVREEAHFIVVVPMFALCRACVSAKEYDDPLAIILCKELTVLSNADMPKTALK